MAAPFVDAAHPELAARVVIQLLQVEYRRTKQYRPSAVALIRSVYARLPAGGFEVVKTALLGLQYAHLEQKKSSKEWLQHAVLASRAGCGFRQCFYADYKANRRR